MENKISSIYCDWNGGIMLPSKRSTNTPLEIAPKGTCFTTSFSKIYISKYIINFAFTFCKDSIDGKTTFKVRSMDFQLTVEPIHCGPYEKYLQSTFPKISLKVYKFGVCNNLTDHGKAVFNKTSMDSQLLAQPDGSNVHETSLLYPYISQKFCDSFYELGFCNNWSGHGKASIFSKLNLSPLVSVTI